MAVTSGKEWRRAREEGVEFTLPLGRTATLRPVPLLSLLKRGEIPDYLTPVAISTVLGDDEAPLIKIMSTADTQGLDPDATLQAMDFMEFLVRQSMVSPRVVDDPQEDDEISIDDVGLEDRGFIVGIALQPAELLERFRHRQTSNVEPVEPNADDEDAA